MHQIYYFPDKVKKLYLQRIKDKMWDEELERGDRSFWTQKRKLILIYFLTTKGYLKTMTVMRRNCNAFFAAELIFARYCM